MLALEGVAEHDVPVRQGRAVIGQFLEPEDDGVAGRVGPAVLRHDGGAGLRVTVGGDDAVGAVFDADLNALCDEGGGALGGEAGAVFVVALFGAEPEMGHAKSFVSRP